MAPGAEGRKLGLQLGLGAFLAYVLVPVLPVLILGFMLLGIACAAVLFADARRRERPERVPPAAGLGLLLTGFLVLLAAFRLAQAAEATGDVGAWRAALWVRVAAETSAAAGFALAALPFAGARSRLLLGLGLGAALATSALAAATASGAAPALLGQDEAAARAAAQDLLGALMAKAMPYILYAWAYASVLGAMRRAPPAAGEAP